MYTQLPFGGFCSSLRYTGIRLRDPKRHDIGPRLPESNLSTNLKPFIKCSLLGGGHWAIISLVMPLVVIDMLANTEPSRTQRLSLIDGESRERAPLTQ